MIAQMECKYDIGTFLTTEIHIICHDETMDIDVDADDFNRDIQMDCRE